MPVMDVDAALAEEFPVSVDLMRLSAVEQAACVRSGEVSARELVEASLAAVERHNPRLNAFVTLCVERALDEADAVRPGDRRPLCGVPVGIKDLLSATEGMPTTEGSRAFGDWVADHDSAHVRRLREAGAIVVGKTNSPELGLRPVTENLRFGATCNPWNPNLSAGGSSGGSAAAVAAGLVGLADGSDLGGSIRIPASCCGVVGPQAEPRPGLDRPRLRRSGGRHAVRRRAHPHRPRCGSRARRDRRRRTGRPTPSGDRLALVRGRGAVRAAAGAGAGGADGPARRACGRRAESRRRRGSRGTGVTRARCARSNARLGRRIVSIELGHLPDRHRAAPAARRRASPRPERRARAPRAGDARLAARFGADLPRRLSRSGRAPLGLRAQHPAATGRTTRSSSPRP